MTTKLMWLLKQGTRYEDMKEMMHKNFTGEINTKMAKIFLNQEIA